MQADDLLAGPRGRGLCWAIAWRTGALGPPVRPLRDVADADIQRAADGLPAASEDLIFECLRAVVDGARYWQDPEDEDAALAPFAGRLMPIAEALAERSDTDWWATAMAAEQFALCRLSDEGDEAVLVLDGNRAVLEEGRAADLRGNATHRDIALRDTDEWSALSGRWWTTPWLSNPATTRALEAGGPVGLSLVEDSWGWTRAVAWPVNPVRSPRVYEVSDAEGWRELVSRYPVDVSYGRGPDWHRALGRRGEWLIPDWLAVADDFDAVHMSVAGYLCAAGAVIKLDERFATTLAGWSPDETYWLTDILTPSDEPVTWVSGARGQSWEPAAS